MARTHAFISVALCIFSCYLTNQASAQTTRQETSRPPLPPPFEFTGSTKNYFTNPNTNKTLTFQVGEKITLRWLTDFELVNIYLNIGPELGSGQTLITNSSETLLEWIVDNFGRKDEPCAFVAARAEEQEGPLDGFASIFFWIEDGEQEASDDNDAAATTTSKISAATSTGAKTAERAAESGQSRMTASSDGDQNASVSQQMLSEETSTPVRSNSTVLSSTANRITTSSEETSLPTVLTSGTSTRYVMGPEPSSTGEATLFGGEEETSDSKPSISTTSAAAIGLGAGLGLLVLLLGVIFVVAIWFRGRKKSGQDVKDNKYAAGDSASCGCSRRAPEVSEGSLPRGSISPVRQQQQV